MTVSVASTAHRCQIFLPDSRGDGIVSVASGAGGADRESLGSVASAFRREMPLDPVRGLEDLVTDCEVPRVFPSARSLEDLEEVADDYKVRG